MNQDKELGIAPIDFIAMLAKGFSGTIPVVGPFVAEVLGTIIPNQRADRFVKFLVAFEERVKKIEVENIELKARFITPEFVDIFEEGATQAVKAFSGERLKYIAQLLSNGLKDSELNHLKTKKLLLLLSQVSDPEIIFLQFYYLVQEGAPGEENEFWLKHQNVMEFKDNSMGMPTENYEDYEIQESYLDNLAHLKLMNKDSSGPPSVTYLGRLLLKSILDTAVTTIDAEVT
jgi:hypothetical protein